MTETAENPIRPLYGAPGLEYVPCCYAMPKKIGEGTPLDDLHRVSGVLLAGTSIYGEEYPHLLRPLALRRLGLLHQLEDAVQEAGQQLVDDCRAAGLSWADIGTTLGVSRQAAQQRFGEK